MRAVRYHSHGGPEVLQVDEVAAPVPGDGQVLIDVEAVAANVIDTVFRKGDGAWSRGLPGALTGEAVGRVAALGDGVAGVVVGDRVAALSEDAFADQIVADARWLAPVPEDTDAGQATVLAMTAPLALRLLRAGRTGPGSTVLVQAAAGGVGHLVLQLAKILGAATVVGTASTKTRRDFAGEWGADAVIDSTDPDWPEHVRAVAPDGVDVVIDAIGGDVFDRGVELLAPLGTMVTYGAIAGTIPTIPAGSLYSHKYVTGVSMTAWRTARPDDARADLTDAADFRNAGRLRTAVHATFPLAEVGRVHEMLDRRENLGRVVVKI